MIRWYADNSELYGIWGSTVPDIFLLGGICANNTALDHLSSIMKEVKAKYDSEIEFPLKWNFRDLNKYYQRQNLETLYERLLNSSRDWRTQIFRKVADVDFTIILSIIHGYSTNRDVLVRTKTDLSRFVFSNALMRVGLHVKEFEPQQVEVVMDWPPGGKRQYFDEEYKSAYSRGETCNQQQGYFCGPLKSLKFIDSLLYTNMTECALLQLSDLIVGAARDTVNYSLGRTKGYFGLNRLKELKDRIRGAPSQVIGKGISIAPPRGELFEKMGKTVAKIYEDPF